MMSVSHMKYRRNDIKDYTRKESRERVDINSRATLK